MGVGQFFFRISQKEVNLFINETEWLDEICELQNKLTFG
jgi:hypothetical protein